MRSPIAFSSSSAADRPQLFGEAAMDAWWMCEVPYPHVPQAVLDAADSVRARLPNRYCDPRGAADLFQEGIDEYLLGAHLGPNPCPAAPHPPPHPLVAPHPLF